MRFSHPWALLGVAVLAGAAAMAAGGCGPSLSMYPPIEGCNLDAGVCGSPSGGGVAVGAGGADGGVTSVNTGTGGVAVGELRGDVERITTPDFLGTSGTPVTGAASITVQPASGPQIVVPYGGADGTTFDMMNVPAGPAWIYVQDQSSGASSIWPTISAVSVPQLGSIVVPVVDQLFFTNLASDLPSVQLRGVSTQAAQIVLLLTLQGQPYSGLQVTGGSNGATVVYDIGPGTYSDQATMTGAGGTILLFDAGGSGMTSISVASMTLMKSYMLPVFTAAGAVTIAGFDLQ